MPRVCTICTHPQRAAIEQALIAGQPIRAIAITYGVSRSSLTRHRDNHLPKALVQAHSAQEAARADRLIGYVVELRENAMRIFREAVNRGKLRTALDALRLCLDATGTLARLAGEMGDRVEITFAESPEWAEIRRLILESLDPFPEAKAVLAAALAEYGGEKGYGD